jgi:hypothetical protein
MAISCRGVSVRFRSALTVWPCLIPLSTVACRPSADRISQEIRNITSAERPPAYLEGVRWKLLRQIYEDRHYRPLWVGTRPVPERTKDLIGLTEPGGQELWRPGSQPPRGPPFWAEGPD